MAIASEATRGGRVPTNAHICLMSARRPTGVAGCMLLWRITFQGISDPV